MCDDLFKSCCSGYSHSWWGHLDLMEYLFSFSFFFSPPKTPRISSEHSPKLQIRSHSYLRAVSEVSINRSLDSLDPAGLLTSPKFRSRNESYMRAMSTISQVGDVHLGQPGERISCWTLLAIGETWFCFKWCSPTLSLNRVLLRISCLVPQIKNFECLKKIFVCWVRC